MHYEILDNKRQELLPLFASLKKKFYLAGGTALALQLGHRRSEDFDFFTREKFDEQRLLVQLKEIFGSRRMEILQQEWQTVDLAVDGIKLSFFYLPYPLLENTIDDANFCLASVTDIGCTKLNAITGRSVNKDFVDLFYIFKQISLPELIVKAKQKMSELNENVVLKSLVYFDELQIEPLEFLPGKEVNTEEIKKFMVAEVKKYMGKK
jgi:hypothetical protein